MKKKIFGFIAVAALAVVAGWNYQQDKQNFQLSGLALENVEALAQDEIKNGYAENNISITHETHDSITHFTYILFSQRG